MDVQIEKKERDLSKHLRALSTRVFYLTLRRQTSRRGWTPHTRNARRRDPPPFGRPRSITAMAQHGLVFVYRYPLHPNTPSHQPPHPSIHTQSQITKAHLLVLVPLDELWHGRQRGVAPAHAVLNDEGVPVLFVVVGRVGFVGDVLAVWSSQAPLIHTLSHTCHPPFPTTQTNRPHKTQSPKPKAPKRT